MMKAWRFSALGLVTAVTLFSAERLLTPSAEHAEEAAANRAEPQDAARGPAEGAVPQRGAADGAASRDADRGADSAAEPVATPPPASISRGLPAPRRYAELDAADEKRQELLAMSDSFRATTLLIAVRQAGYLCRNLLGVEPSAIGLAAWRVTCEDTLAYWVGVDAHGALAVDLSPAIDSIVPAIVSPEQQAAPPGEPFGGRGEQLQLRQQR